MRRSYLTLAAVCTCWGTVPLVAGQVDLPAPAIVLGRVWVSAAALALALVANRARLKGRAVANAPSPGTEGPHSPGAPWRLTGLGHHSWRLLGAGVLLAFHWTTMFAAYQRARPETVIFVIFLAPVGVALLAPRALGERVGPRTLSALGLALTGFVLVAGPDVGPGSGAGIALASLACVSFVALLLVSKPLAALYGGLRLALAQMVVGGLALLPLAFTTDWGRPRAAWAWLVVLGVVHTALFGSLYLSALGRVPATHAAILGYLEPAGVVVFSWLVLGSAPRVATLAGGLLIAAAGWVVVAAGERPPSPQPASPMGPTGFAPDRPREVPLRVPG